MCNIRHTMNEQTPLILVTNDDGIASPGLTAAVQAVQGLGTVVVAAPTTQQTARGRSMVGNDADFFHPVELAGIGNTVPAYHIDASPALVVRHALNTLLAGRRPHLIVSGINFGENLGNNIMISGTVGAAFQGAAAGIPALAVSRQTAIEHHYEYGDLDWTDAIRVTRRYAERLLMQPSVGALPACDVLKVDIPDPCPPGTEERLTRLSRRPYFVSVLHDAAPHTPLGASQTTIVVDAAHLDPADDIYALAVDRVVSVTPLTLDCTAPYEPLAYGAVID